MLTVQLPAGSSLPARRCSMPWARCHMVRRPAVGATSLRVETSGLAPGVYALRMLAGGTAPTRRVVVK